MGVIGFIGRRLDRRCEYSAVGVIREIDRGNLGGFTPMLTCVEVWDAWAAPVPAVVDKYELLALNSAEVVDMAFERRAPATFISCSFFSSICGSILDSEEVLGLSSASSLPHGSSVPSSTSDMTMMMFERSIPGLIRWYLNSSAFDT